MGLIRRNLKKSAWGRRFLKGRILATQQPDWSRLPLAEVKPSTDSKRILIATDHGGWILGSTVESLIAAALKARGHDVHVLLCDGVLPACFECELDLLDIPSMAKNGPAKTLCKHCTTHTRAMYQQLGVTLHSYSDYLELADLEYAKDISQRTSLEQLPSIKLDDIPVGEHAMAGTLRYFGRANLNGVSHAEAIAKRYLEAAVLTSIVARKLLRKHTFDCSVFHHGIYVPQGIIGAVARAENTRVVNWNPIWRKQTFIFSHNDTYHHTLLTDSNSLWENMEWNSAKEKKVMDYLEKRRLGTEDWIWFHNDPQFDKHCIEQETGIDLSKPTIGLLTNVLWDAQLHYADNAFANMLDWMMKTIAWFAKNPQLQLLIRIHPAELRGSVPSMQPLLAEIQKHFPSTPKNVFIIKPESKISTYAAMEYCDSAIIYGTKTGMELSAMGIPVIVAGEAWIRNKGIAIDVSDEAHYYNELAKLPYKKRLEGDRLTRAKKYAYHFIFERMIPLECMKPAKDGLHARLEIPKLSDLQPNGMRGLDIICDGILEGKPFIYRDSL